MSGLDRISRPSHWIFPSKTTPGAADPSDYEHYGYDADGNRVWLRKRDGGVFVYTFDALNRVVVKETPGNLANVRYAYDLRGLQSAAWFTGNGWGVFNAWDGFGRLASTTTDMGGYSRTVSHQYDRDGREAELTSDGRLRSESRSNDAHCERPRRRALPEKIAYSCHGLAGCCRARPRLVVVVPTAESRLGREP